MSGQFEYEELLNLDIKDLNFWAKQARIKTLLVKQERYIAARLGMAKDEGFRQEMYRIKYDILGLLKEDN